MNAAGVGILGSLGEVPLDDVHRLWDVNVLGALHGARAALPPMRARGRGVIIDISSMLGAAVQAPYMGAYAASKAALVTLDETLRRELSLAGDHGVTVCTVLPTGVDTPFFDHAANHTGRRLRALPAVATPERVARAVVHAAARPRRRVTVGPGARLLPAATAVARRPLLGLIAWRTEHHYLGAPGSADDTEGRLRLPSGASAAVRGGRAGRARTAARAACAASVLGAAAAAGARAVARTRSRPASSLPRPFARPVRRPRSWLNGTD
ncbi:hypothetical protein GCM10017752_04450 [Streptomyces roseoviridis]